MHTGAHVQARDARSACRAPSWSPSLTALSDDKSGARGVELRTGAKSKLFVSPAERTHSITLICTNAPSMMVFVSACDKMPVRNDMLLLTASSGE